MAVKFGNNRNVPQTSCPSQEAGSTSQANNASFTRYVGYNDKTEFENKLIDLYANTQNNGLFFDKNIPNPSGPEGNRLNSINGINEALTKDNITKILTTLASSGNLDFSKIGNGHSTASAAEIIYNSIEELKADGNNDGAIKNQFIKFICWFMRYSNYQTSNVLFIGNITKSEIYWFNILSKMGCTITYVNFESDDCYLKNDPKSKYSVLVKGSSFVPINIDFHKINLKDYSRAKQIQNIVSAPTSVMVKLLNTTPETMSHDLISDQTARKASIMCTDSTVPVYFLACFGTDEDISIYKNMLFNLKEDLTSKKKQLVLITELANPNHEEANTFYQVVNTNDNTMINLIASKITVSDNLGRTALIQKAFVESMSAFGTNNLHNACITVAAWIKRYTSGLDLFQNDLPVIYFYGNINPTGAVFLNIMSKAGFDVFFFCPDKSMQNVFTGVNSNAQIMEKPVSAAVTPFPDKLIKVKMATSAYSAEQSLDTLLYNDNVMFREHQFTRAQNQTLKTTYEELNLMWHQEAKYRTGFDSKNNYVIIPNIFAKINGIKNNDVSAYSKEIQFKLSPLSVYYNRIPFFKPGNSNDYYGALYNGTQLKINELKKSKYNRFNYLNDDLQNYIFEKMQEVIDSGFIDIPVKDLVPIVIKTGFYMPPNLIKIIQNFDYTKDIPKIVIVSNSKFTFNIFECVLLVLLNLIGFDIVIYTPTGYKNLETYIKPDAYEVFNCGEFKDNYVTQNFKIPKTIPHEKESFFGRLFKGKK